MLDLFNVIAQTWPGRPKFKEADLPDLLGKIVVVTGSNTGVGKQVAKILYSRNAKVYMAGRSESKMREAIDEITAAYPQSKGQMVFIHLDLTDLESVQTSAREYSKKEEKLHVLFNNAGVGYPPADSRTKQGYPVPIGVNCIGTFLFTRLLTPVLAETAKTAEAGSVRVIWTASSAMWSLNMTSFMKNMDHQEKEVPFQQYANTKGGNYFQATEYAARHRPDKIVSIPINPGNLDSDFTRDMNPIVTWILRALVLYPPVYGAYTTLYAGFSSDITVKNSGSYVAPWGRLGKTNAEFEKAIQSESEGGTALASKFWEWCEKQSKPYLE